MRLSKRSKYPKALIIYISAILVLTVVLLSIGIGSISRERQRLESLSNIELQATISPGHVAAKIQQSKRDILYLAFANLLFLTVIAVGTMQVSQIAREYLREIKSRFFIV